MPGGDRTGPMGAGVGTGRRAGFCYGNNQPGFVTGGGWGGRGGGRGRRNFAGMPGNFGGGRGRGFGFRYRSEDIPQTPMMVDSWQQELIRLAEETRQCTEALNKISKRLDELQAEKE